MDAIGGEQNNEKKKKHIRHKAAQLPCEYCNQRHGNGEKGQQIAS